MIKSKKIKLNQPSEFTQELTDYTLSEGVSAFSENPSVLRGVKILGLHSTNGRTYSSEAVDKAKVLYEGAKVNVNHPKGDPKSPRDYQDRIGNIQDVVYKPGVGLFADFYINPCHPLAEQLMWDARHAPGNVGFSHNIQAKTVADSSGNVTVNEILAVRSVDIVADPATTSGLFESKHLENSGLMESIQTELQMLREKMETLREQYEEILKRSPMFNFPESREQETTFEKSQETLPDFIKKILSR